MWSDLGALASDLSGSAVTAGLDFRGKESVYLTNVVKHWVPGGKRAALVDEGWFTRGRTVLAEEFRVLASWGRFPHVLVVVGARPWPHVCAALQASAAAWSGAAGPPVPHAGPHDYLNVLHVHEGGGVRPALMVRIGHSSRPGRGRTPGRLRSDPQYRQAAGLGDNALAGAGARGGEVAGNEVPAAR